jgi:hypothetical protein
MTENRKTRDLESREKTTRKVYKPSSTLPDPTPIPGYRFRWIATHILSQADPTNVSRKMRDGWVPVKAVDHPELMLAPSEKTGNVEVGGLMLCKIPEDLAESMDDYYFDQARSQMESVDNTFLRQNDPRMPLFADRKSSTPRGGAGLS